MKLYSENDSYKLYDGNMLDMLDVIEPNSIDSIVTDPPYELGFMGKSWDKSGIAFQKETWEKCFKVLKPGGHLLAFGGSRTYHRIACAIEDAGFEIRDTIMWLYGSGFPKSMNISKGLEAREKLGNACTRNKRKIEQSCDTVSYSLKQANNGVMGEVVETTRKEYIPNTDLAKQWEGWGTCLKPSFEPIIVARKPFFGSLVDNIIQYGVGGINVDECRVGDEEVATHKAPKGTFAGGDWDRGSDTSSYETHSGRFPSNVIHDGSQEAIGALPYTKGKASGYNFEQSNQGNPSHLYTNIKSGVHFGDEGSASRYFYCAKASKKDRDEGLDDFEEIDTTKLLNRKEGSAGVLWKQGGTNAFSGAGGVKKNTHPTVKPMELMQYLIRLVTPKNGIVLDPFNGSGSTGKAAMYENLEKNKNYKYIGIELQKEYLPIAKARIEFVQKQNTQLNFL